MTPLFLDQVEAHRVAVPWSDIKHVEQDLLLCRAIHAIFSNEFLATHVAMRGGTVLHKVHLLPPARYSEDIDLVATSSRSAEMFRVAFRDALRAILGTPRRSLVDDVQLAIRNVVSPSKILRTVYELPSVSIPGKSISIKIEVNLTEITSHREKVAREFEFPFDGTAYRCTVNSFDIHEMLGTKMRALFQRKAGRDLFDLHHALQIDPSIDASAVIDSFLYYMKREGTVVTRQDFIARLQQHLADSGFRSDMNALLRTGIHYDARSAGEAIKSRLLSLLPDENRATSIRSTSGVGPTRGRK